jgi:hypothetical protein
MPNALDPRQQLLLNTLGHAAGVLIFAIFLVLLARYHTQGNSRRLPALAAALALAWNAASLAVLGMGDSAGLRPRLAAAFAFSTLSFLPAVLLHLSLPSRLIRVVQAGYSLAAGAIALHLAEIAMLPARDIHVLGLRLITFGFGVLTVISAVLLAISPREDRRSLASRILASMSLFLFAISFIHFREGHAHPGVSSDLALHHAGIPLAIFVLLQDYRFVLLDAFVRFLANALLAALAALALISGLAWFAPLALPDEPFVKALLLAGACLLLFGYTAARSALQHVLTRMVFRRPDAEAVARQLRQAASQAENEAEYLERAAAAMARLMDARPVGFVKSRELAGSDLLMPIPASHVGEFAGEMARRGVEVIVPIRLSHADVRYALLGPRRGGRPYLSGDLELLARASLRVAEQVEELRESEVRRLVSQAELRALQSQIHPHFLFNALNTLYGIIPKESAGARRTVLNLADIFRYFLRSETTFVPLDEEMRIVEAYLEIEKLRLGDKLHVELLIDEQARSCHIPLLSIEPLIENAVKHGVARRPEGGRIRLEVRKGPVGLSIRVEDTGPGFDARNDGREGLGLNNVERRLQLCYGGRAALEVTTGPDGAAVAFTVPNPQAVGAPS